MKHPWNTDIRSMLSVSIEDRHDALQDLYTEVEDKRALQEGSIPRARTAIARECKVAAGTLENFRRGRLKDLRGRIRDRISNFVVQSLQREISRAQSDLEIAMRLASRPDDAAIFKARVAVTHAQQLVRELSGEVEGGMK